ncbi:hypothetical protein MHA01_24020 [Marinococcus halophilus]|uniref:Uncharacterized protein n=1 Tax=Marinococcus halophilus TaxID=1371 RepID=A0A510YAU5_MARHA|nr:hypothetical protein MHA01_24020 [Marinococcus halophilus]
MKKTSIRTGMLRTDEKTIHKFSKSPAAPGFKCSRAFFSSSLEGKKKRSQKIALAEKLFCSSL